MADLRGGPPPRWRVVERDRRLVVIDTVTGTTPAGAPLPPSAAPWLPRKLQFDGSAELATRAFYDDKAPRTIRLDADSAATIGRVRLIAVFVAFGWLLAGIANLWLLLPVFLLWNSNVRAGLRRAVTAWLDTVEREAS